MIKKSFQKRYDLIIFILSGLIFLVIIKAGIFLASRTDSNQKTASLPRQEEFKQNIKRVYETKMAPLARDFVARDNEGSIEERLALISKTREEALALNVPKEYTDMHLEFVIALSQMEAGYKGDAAKLALGQEKLREILDSNPWLR